MSFIVSELIRKKRDGLELTNDEIHFLVSGFATSSIPDYQISAWLMASFFRGMTVEETFQLTVEMKNSGRSLDWRSLSTNFQDEKFADKHSTGGVGDKVSLILAPVAACLGLKVPMMSGQGLGHTGGTVDKLQSIPGFNMYPTEEQMIRGLDEVGLCMMAQAKDLCPADRKLYSLRDVTSTVESLPLITASILSKKWAEGVDAIVFDVKMGNAAFMQKFSDAQLLARSLVETAKRAGLKALSVITRMDEPLGMMIGNALEVKESLEILRGHQNSPLKTLSLKLAAEMAVLAGTRKDIDSAMQDAEASIRNGQALEKFFLMAKTQNAVEGWEEKLAEAPLRIPLLSPHTGYIKNIGSRALGIAGLKIGVGRRRAEDSVDPAVGFEMSVIPGQKIDKDEPLLWMHLRSKEQFAELAPELLSCFEYSQTGHILPELILERLR